MTEYSFSFRTDKATARALAKLAAMERRSRNNYLNLLLQREVEKLADALRQPAQARGGRTDVRESMRA